MSKRENTGGDLFIVDNSDSDWKVRQYLHDWTEIASTIDIATGYFEIGALLALDGQWQKLDGLRILLGDEVSGRTKKALLRAAASNALKRLDASIEDEKKSNDFLDGVDGIVDGLRAGKIRCRVYSKEKFHAKAYINHARQAVIGSAALVGSSNFTTPGLTDNVELNIQVRGREVELLQEWYEKHWNDAEELSDDVLKVVERHAREYPPFDVYAKALHEYFRGGGSLNPDDWDLRQSKLFPQLDRYQQDGYRNLLKIAAKYNGALLCDGVGLGKTYIGLMLIERFAVLERKRVLLLVPKSGRDTVWGPEIARKLPHLNGLFGRSLVVLNHTDLSAASMEKTVQDAAAEADIVIIDEAHNFRNIGTRGEFIGDIVEGAPARGGKLIEGEGKVRPSRYRRLFELIGDKKTFLLTATPVNNDLSDLRHLIELFSRRRDDYFANHDIAIKNLRSYFSELKRRLQNAPAADATVITDAQEARGVLESDPLVSALVVQRSRGYVKESQKLHGGRGVIFPDREPPKVAEYSLKGVYGNLLKTIADAFNKNDPLFSLPMYQPLLYSKLEIDPENQEERFSVGRQQQIVALIRTAFLKRLESSAEAFRLSCDRLLIRLLAFIVRNVQLEKHKSAFLRWQKTHRSLVDELKDKHPHLFTLPQEDTLFDRDGDEAEDDADELLDPDLLEGIERYDRQEFNVDEMVEKTLDDLDVVAQLLDEVRRVEPKRDAKLQTLIKLLKTDKVLKDHKVMIFTEFADTAEYLRHELTNAGITGIESVNGSHAARDRVSVVKRFAPYYNRADSAQATRLGGEIRVLISTDVLSEGLNLQDATRLINFDLHWNPVRLMQRIGRIDRRMNPEIEAALLADHPDQAPLRGTACYWNFLPPDELNVLLSLYARVTHKTLNISKTFGIEGKQLLHPKDDFEALRDFNAVYEQQTKVEELSLEYDKLLKTDPGLAAHLDSLPGRIFSGKAHISPTAKAVFFCYQLPTRIQEPWGGPPEQQLDFTEPPIDGWSVTQGPVRWYVYDLEANRILDLDTPSTAALIRCEPAEPRKVVASRPTLIKARAAIDKHIRDTYLKQTQAPVSAPKPVLKCWMELC